ncbi:hypothetical protein QUA56_08085 [Microcoleus sp. N3A4]|uniref:hypothetical protein n=1 Tax=Microcoleus sp. N3A4 TaxID=3055379 RepID=UPI002FD2EACE
MATITKTFGTKLLPAYVADAIVEVVHFRGMTFDTDELTAFYLDKATAIVDVGSFNIGKIPDLDGDESDIEKALAMTKAESLSNRVGLRFLTRKDNTGSWDEVAEFIILNFGRKDYLDLRGRLGYPAMILEKNDALAVQLVDYGDGLLWDTDFIKINFGVTVEIEKKNNVDALTARISALELALEGRIINVSAGTVLGRNTGTGVVQQLPQSQFATPAMIDQAIIDLAGGAPGAMNTLVELAAALNNDANFASTIASNLATINSRIASIESKKSVVVSTPLNIAANTWFTVGQIDAVGFASTEAIYACAVYIQYGDGTNTYGHWQYSGGGVISSIQWKAGGTQLATTFKMEAHNASDFNCSVRFTLSNVNRTIQVMFDIPIVTQVPSILRVTLKRII